MQRLSSTRPFWRAYFWVYDRNRSTPYVKLIKQNAELVVGKKTDGVYLDLGCGTGNSTIAIHQQLNGRGQVIGLDNSPEAITRAEKKAPAEIEFRLASMEATLSFPAGGASGVLANNSLYLVSDPKQTLLEIMRVLKPGGRFVMTNPSAGARPQQIFQEHLQEKRAEFRQCYQPLAAKLMMAGHLIKAIFNFLLILPFNLVLKHDLKVGSHFWPLEKWEGIIAEIQREGKYKFTVQPPFAAYAGTNYTFVIDRLPD
ncbi:MAG: class I SAM-dependent methyltransferase [Candidatus Margulisbacteria bacterium]|jgi:ubiquinone/menaquinone biosynthesis C-methylase UbiE|nr:class I SAM-dependent methyltransferase [Candidatus Margulisiibacteriota bacterium]